ncbi:SDR family NAD(P)-dependent oxidoreductase [Natronoarchaeum rubrum]|uniref:SDR family NAD(P)-dependent oxidoreductase n=1 Tax=Natronoarchaeum rubrum TaxID=755311 RepID=UPI002112CF72|nr:glucose 1-dehydrogenase [Natronoarchaeum rubrum]
MTDGPVAPSPAETPCPDRFDGDVVVVTGSTRGLGETIARRFAAEGAAVVVSGRTVEDGEAVAASIREDEGEATFVEVDLRDPDAVAALIDAAAEEYGTLDVVVNNAGVETYTGVEEATMEDWNLVVETDLRAYWLCVKRAAEHMNEGAVVNVSSNHAFATTPEMFPYNAVKPAVEGMTRAMALDLGPEIRVNSVAPGWTEIERTTEGLDEETHERAKASHPLGRLGRPEDIAGAVTFLASDDAAFVTGTSLVVDGGRTAVLQDDALPDYRRE